jgi:G:T/U-mismatch repair DNA glycosylase
MRRSPYSASTTMPRPPRQGVKADLQSAAGKTIPDVVAPDLAVLFVGINPSLTSGATGWHFAHPGNRFWRALYEADLTPRLLRPAEQREMLDYGLGLTNLVPRATAKASEVDADELRAGARRLRRMVARLHPAWVAMVGVTAYGGLQTHREDRAAERHPRFSTRLGTAESQRSERALHAGRSGRRVRPPSRGCHGAAVGSGASDAREGARRKAGRDAMRGVEPRSEAVEPRCGGRAAKRGGQAARRRGIAT